MMVLSSYELWIGLCLLGAIFAFTLKRGVALKPLIGFAVSIGITDLIAFQALKPAFGRLRPCYALEEVHLVQGRCGGDFGFPSNHAANSGAAVAFLSLITNRKILLIGTFAAILVCFSRVYLGVHYPADVVCGFIIGLIISRLVLKNIFRIKPLEQSALKVDH
jgi:undecaprenyl-diphosphatase